jgi:ABC-type nitrate/sulfonate/bicarbonate transport system substrate-binding protein
MRRITKLVVVVVSLFVGTTTVALNSANGASASPHERFQIIFVGRNGVDGPTKAQASGLFADHGIGTQVLDSPTSQSQSGRFTLRLTHGSITGNFVEINYQINFNPKACMASPTSQGAMTITGGSRKYAGATGTLAFTTKGRIIGKKDPNGKCLAQSAPPSSSNVQLEAIGWVKID